jgi:hypothetical protein
MHVAEKHQTLLGDATGEVHSQQRLNLLRDELSWSACLLLERVQVLVDVAHDEAPMTFLELAQDRTRDKSAANQRGVDTLGPQPEPVVCVGYDTCQALPHSVV